MSHKHIHRILRKHSPKGIHKAKRLFAFKYPKLLLLTATIILSYYLFSLPQVKDFVLNLDQFNYLSDFIAGIFFSFGFTTPLSIGYFVTTYSENIFLTSIIAGIGSVIGISSFSKL